MSDPNARTYWPGCGSSPGARGDGEDYETLSIETKIMAWAAARHKSKVVGNGEIMLKLAEEVGELAEAMRKDTNVTEEAADVAILLVQLCQQRGTSLSAVIEAKLPVLWDRLRNGKRNAKNDEIAALKAEIVYYKERCDNLFNDLAAESEGNRQR